jgi:hypothetical protein
MEPNEVQELHEQHEHAAGHEEHAAPNLKPVSFTMSVLAVLVAIVTVLGHRTHTQAVLEQARASDQWNLYQAKKIRQYNTTLAEDLLSNVAVADKAKAGSTLATYKAHLSKWDSDLSAEQETAHKFEEQVEVAESKASWFDLGEAMLEIALVVTSITLLTRQRMYWVLGMIFGAAGLLVSAMGLLGHRF